MANREKPAQTPKDARRAAALKRNLARRKAAKQGPAAAEDGPPCEGERRSP